MILMALRLGGRYIYMSSVLVVIALLLLLDIARRIGKKGA